MVSNNNELRSLKTFHILSSEGSPKYFLVYNYYTLQGMTILQFSIRMDVFVYECFYKLIKFFFTQPLSGLKRAIYNTEIPRNLWKDRVWWPHTAHLSISETFAQCTKGSPVLACLRPPLFRTTGRVCRQKTSGGTFTVFIAQPFPCFSGVYGRDDMGQPFRWSCYKNAEPFFFLRRGWSEQP